MVLEFFIDSKSMHALSVPIPDQKVAGEWRWTVDVADWVHLSTGLFLCVVLRGKCKIPPANYVYPINMYFSSYKLFSLYLRSSYKLFLYTHLRSSSQQHAIEIMRLTSGIRNTRDKGCAVRYKIASHIHGGCRRRKPRAKIKDYMVYTTGTTELRLHLKPQSLLYSFPTCC